MDGKCTYTCTYTYLFITVLVLVQFGHVLMAVVEEEDGVARDRASLVAFMSVIVDDPQKSFESWNSSTLHVCNWTGITCHPVKRRVVQLDLSGRSISGTISPSLSNLSFLDVLDLSKNFFGGPIPAELGRLTRLTQLSLATNVLTGSIPAELGFLGKLVYLDMGGNRLNGGIPEALICGCSSLQYIDLSNNSLTGSISLGKHCKLSELRFLLLWSNNLVGPIPQALSNSSKLEWVDLESNYLSGELPSTIFYQMPVLQFLYLSYNNFTSHDHNTNLEPFFASLASCPRLQELELAGNGLGGVMPPVVGNLSINLVQLHLEENNIFGPIPPNISNLLNLTYLNLSNNFLNGSIPPDIAQIKKLERVYLSNNLLTGEIPPVFGSIPHLGLLDISGNMITGSIPHTLSNLSQLRTLLLYNNHLSGTIPPTLGNCNNLEILDLSHNRLSGFIPSEVAGLSSLKLYLNLSSNSLQGPLPLELSKMDMVIALDLSSNNFSGMVPSQLGSCVALEYLNLSGNNLHGYLPVSIGSLPYLEVLDLSSNQLMGALPESLQASSSLKNLNVSFNDFSGTVPNEGVFSVLTSDSFRGNSGLCGLVSGITPCRSKRVHGRFILLPLLLTLIGTPFLLCLFGYLFLARSSRSRSWSSPFSYLFNSPMLEDEEQARKRDYPRISYRQLVEATGGFEGSNLIGAGSFGRVYKGVLRDETRIAVKVLDPKGGSGDHQMSGSFKRECEVLKRTRHRNLIRIVTTCSRPDFKALVLPLMSNGSLESHLYSGDNTGGLNLVQLVNISSNVAEGMAYLHHYSPVRVVHCDLKPSNVLLDEDMNAIVSDFGISRLVNGGGGDDEGPDTSSWNSMTGLLCGSVGYIAPEYGMGGHPSPQGDVYSFGVLLLEMITGKRPTDVLFQEGSTQQDWVKSHYPHNLDPIVQQTLFKSPPLTTTNYYCSKLWRDVVVELIELGLVCTQLSPSTRPTMIDVAHEIGQLKEYLTRINANHTDESSSLPDSSF